MTCTPRYTGSFVNVYLIDRRYGGPEEGGWWYDSGEAIRSTQVRATPAAGRFLQRIKAWCDRENANRRSDINSVLSEGRYVVYLEDEPAADYPAERPHYE